MYPVTIIRARYGGTYEGGKWLAFNLRYEHIPAEVAASDVPCSTFFHIHRGSYGFGDTPDAALAMLKLIEEPLRMEYEHGKGWKLIHIRHIEEQLKGTRGRQ